LAAAHGPIELLRRASGEGSSRYRFARRYRRCRRALGGRAQRDLNVLRASRASSARR